MSKEKGLGFPVKEMPKKEFNMAELFNSSEKLEEYQKWKKEVDWQSRRLVEARLKNREGKIDKNHSPLVGQFYRGFQSLLSSPDLKLKDLNFLDKRASKILLSLQDVEINEQGDRVNIFKALVDERTSFKNKTSYFSNFISSRLNFLKFKDKEDLEKYSKQKKQEEEEIEISLSQEDDEYEPHRSPSQEKEGQPKAIAVVYPFFGGYYKSRAYQFFNTKTLKWKKAEPIFESLNSQKIEQEKKRIEYKAIVSGQKMVVELPQKWGLDQKSIKWKGEAPESFSFWQDQNGLACIEVSGQNQRYDFSLEIGPSDEYLKPSPPKDKEENIGKIEFPVDLMEKAKNISRKEIPLAVKFRQIVSFIRQNLKYDKDNFSLEGIYKQEIEKYFLKIWEHKKAKCDEANTLATLVFGDLGYKARFVSGHSVSAKSTQGEALLLESNRHAWLEAYDEENNEWLRLDATPKGDNNVDQEEQEEDLGEGDWGEQEAELMSDKELEKALAEMEKKEIEESTKPEIIFAREAGCSPEEAKEVLEKIAKLREKYKKERKEMNDYWRQVLRKNTREKSTYSGPVRQSRGDYLANPVAAFLDIISGQDDPTGFEVERKTLQEEKVFGGYEVYLLADMSGSMNWLLGGVKKSESQRDMVFLLMDSVMMGAAIMRQQEKRLKYPIPNKVCLTVFGKKTEIVLPLTDKWGPAEQIKIYRSLDETANGRTPDHEALKMVEEQIKKSKIEEEVEGRKTKNKDWKMNRFVIATADGGSDNFSQVKKANDRLAEMNIPTNLLLTCQEEDGNIQEVASQTYQEVSVVPDITGLAKKGMEVLIRRIKEIYGE